ncbi:hypothetical protein [Chamaesiphon minutus]|uniref:Secreted protein n=1 Tax=Chamaesiphon minutus (strain ATCC 27169 / PCC 6605) TaxID=1173020 RepID=K9UNY7_CHAP6|nr:hypothetical protein [Chamaesiphon minutus]AFY95904.1 hypothetical protein Cha6605_4997 [Chamaesiphon minutus PCC 6605]
MRKFLSCGLIAAFATIPTALQVCAEPPPKEPETVITQSTVVSDCTERCTPSMEGK